MTRAALALAATLAAAAPALAAPMLPHQLRIVPVYDTPPAIRLSWIDRGNVLPYHYDIYREVDGGGYGFLTTIAGGPADHPGVYLDAGVVATSTYSYRIDVVDSTGRDNTTPFTTSPRVVWPIVGGHEVMHGFNEVVGWNGVGAELKLVNPGPPPRFEAVSTGYHMGVDLNKTTGAGLVTGNVVVAPRGGFVNDINGLANPDNAAIGIGVDVGGGRIEYDTFNHIATIGATAPSVAIGDVVAPGQPIAHIGSINQFSGDFAKHVHFQQERYPIPAGQQRLIRHPLAVFTDAADRDPLGNPPALFDENKDGKVVLYRDHGTGNLIAYDLATNPLRGDVDVEPEVVDKQGTDPGEAPIDLGYWIEGPLPETEEQDDVKSAAHPYRLYDFRVEYFGGIPHTSAPIPCNLVADIADGANAGCPGLTDCTTFPGVACSSVIKEGTTPWDYPVLHHFIVTHAQGETGVGGDVDGTQFWRTAAKDDGAAVGSTHANYAGQPTTTKAWEARFPDGDYTIHVIASDLVHANVDLKLPVARIENFAPFVKEIIVGQDADGNPSTGQPLLTGCEVIVHHYRHTHRQPYLRPQDVLVSKVATTVLHGGQKLCVLIRFSEPIMSVAVDLVRDRGAGAAVPGTAFTGALSKTYNTDDTWIGAVTLPVDASGASDASPADDEHDAAIHIVAFDRRDASATARGLDANSDGIPEPGGDVSHVVKLDLSRPTGLLDAEKP